MRELSRRDLVEVLVRGTASGFLVASLGSCSRDSALVELTRDLAILPSGDAGDSLRALCADELGGFRLGPGFHPQTWAPEPGPGFDSLYVADGFTLMGGWEDGRSHTVDVRYSLVGEFDGLHLSRKAARFVTFPYRLRRSDGAYRISFCHPIIVTKDVAKAHFEGLFKNHLDAEHLILGQDKSLAVANLRRLINGPSLDPASKATLMKRLARVQSGYYARRDFNERRSSLSEALAAIEAL